jgi:hypothetical protein
MKPGGLKPATSTWVLESHPALTAGGLGPRQYGIVCLACGISGIVRPSRRATSGIPSPTGKPKVSA